ncbi:MAG: CBS and ACT domain-containing protein [Acidaminococcus sp.]|jgi:acetoin utilization protein AcuB|nr:CBS and ACT domain-containing protein [Acidaminococcus sp.]MCI2100729.1 CBS and ACT domain-containing protein [Acidaminococcus sp.]MCI2115050.1 CBS and ACT domain-containing protein [Acidaminococcus sp.]MCI2117126.1 CBS and ACT domain-containing protein [Acidaminococcus sp.]
MKVEELMTKVVKVVKADQSLLEIRELMLNNNLRRIPVVDKEGHLKGIVTDGDVSRATPSDASTLDRYEANYILGKLKAQDLMTKAVITVKAEDGVETAAYLMYKNKIGALPVVNENNEIVGIISDTDIFKAFVDLLGYAKTSTKITIDTLDRVGVLADLTQIFKDRGVNIISVITRKLGPKRAAVTVRANLTNAMDIIQTIRDAGFVITEISTLKVDDRHES